jgi:hypothetical protein
MTFSIINIQLYKVGLSVEIEQEKLVNSNNPFTILCYFIVLFQVCMLPVLALPVKGLSVN